MRGEYEPGGEGWWVASDGLWYPPETHPDVLGRRASWPSVLSQSQVLRRLYRIAATGIVSLIAAVLVSGLADHRLSGDASAALGVGSWALFWVAAWMTWGHMRRKAKWLPVWAWASLGCMMAFGLFSADGPATGVDDPAIVVNVQSSGGGDVQPVVALPTPTAMTAAAAPVAATSTAVASAATPAPPTATAVPPAPTATAVPPAATPRPAPPTATAVPPTATAVPPPPTRVPVPPTVAPQPVAPPATQDCTPGYDPCIPPGPDVDCAGGSGNGPRYVGRVTVTGSDPYGLDRDNDGVGCE